MTDQPAAVRIITNSTRKLLSEVRQRCTEALKALDQVDHLLALAAMIGLEKQIRSINARLLVLREVFEVQNAKTKQKG